MFRDNTQQARLRSTYLPLAGLSAERGKVTGQTEPLTYTDEAGEAWTFWALAPRVLIMGRKTEAVWLTNGHAFRMAAVEDGHVLKAWEPGPLNTSVPDFCHLAAGTEWLTPNTMPASRGGYHPYLPDEVTGAQRTVSIPKSLKRTGVTDVDEIVKASAKDTEGRCTYTLTRKLVSTNVDFSRTETVTTTTVRAGAATMEVSR